MINIPSAFLNRRVFITLKNPVLMKNLEECSAIIGFIVSFSDFNREIKIFVSSEPNLGEGWTTYGNDIVIDLDNIVSIQLCEKIIKDKKVYVVE